MSSAVSLVDRWQNAVLAMLPTIRRYAGLAFRHLRGDNHDDAVQEAIANVCAALARLGRRNRLDRAFPTVLAQFAIRQVRAGRKMGTPQNSRDAWRASRRSEGDAGWLEAVVEDPHTPVFEQVCFRLDFPAWLNALPRPQRRIAQLLALGHSTSDVAAACGLTAGRISQLRRELHASWQAFQGEGAAVALAAAA